MEGTTGRSQKDEREMSRAPRKKQQPIYLRLQSSAMARQTMEPAIERYLEKSAYTYDTSTHPSGLRTYFVSVSSEADAKSIVEGFDEPLVAEAPSLTHLFWAFDRGGSWNAGTKQQHIRRGRTDVGSGAVISDGERQRNNEVDSDRNNDGDAHKRQRRSRTGSNGGGVSSGNGARSGGGNRSSDTGRSRSRIKKDAGRSAESGNTVRQDDDSRGVRRAKGRSRGAQGRDIEYLHRSGDGSKPTSLNGAGTTTNRTRKRIKR